MNSVERQIMAHISDLNPGGHHREQMRLLLSRNMDGDRLIITAIKEGVAGLLYKYLLEAELLGALSHKQRKKL